ncbi:MAG TPA: hypothetical protein VG456_22325 [Candidatus Sulfopaludibacter sp.]|jgi:hypothetical protein|nr:hypothetical protein [Candidatus Sulfopaludibacter sp.]
MMERFTPEERRMAEYLLAILPENERRQIADRILVDEELYASLASMEESLIDSYARSELLPEEARMVEAALLSTVEGRARYRTAQALAAHERRTSRRYRNQWLLCAAALLVTCGLIFEFGAIRRVPLPQAASIVLPGEALRGSSHVESRTLPPGDGAVSFALPVAAADHVSRYAVLVRTPRRTELNLPARESSGAVYFTVDRALLQPGRYEFELYALPARTLLSYTPIDLLAGPR